MDKCSLCIILEETIFGSEWIYVIINTCRGCCKGIRLKHECFQHPRGAAVFYLINCLECSITLTFCFLISEVCINKATLKLFVGENALFLFFKKRQNDVAQKSQLCCCKEQERAQRRFFKDLWTYFYRQFVVCIFICVCLGKVNYLRGTGFLDISGSYFCFCRKLRGPIMASCQCCKGSVDFLSWHAVGHRRAVSIIDLIAGVFWK